MDKDLVNIIKACANKPDVYTPEMCAEDVREHILASLTTDGILTEEAIKELEGDTFRDWKGRVTGEEADMHFYKAIATLQKALCDIEKEKELQDLAEETRMGVCSECGGKGRFNYPINAGVPDYECPTCKGTGIKPQGKIGRLTEETVKTRLRNLIHKIQNWENKRDYTAVNARKKPDVDGLTEESIEEEAKAILSLQPQVKYERSRFCLHLVGKSFQGGGVDNA